MARPPFKLYATLKSNVSPMAVVPIIAETVTNTLRPAVNATCAVVGPANTKVPFVGCVQTDPVTNTFVTIPDGPEGPGGPAGVSAYWAYGRDVSACLGVSGMNVPVFVPGRTPISSQRLAPLNIPAPKSKVTVNNPLLTFTSSFVSTLDTRVPPDPAS